MKKFEQQGFGRSNSPKGHPSKPETAKISASDAQKEQQALLLINDGNLYEAERIYRELVLSGSNSHIVYGNYGALLKMKGDSENAVRYLKKAIQLDSKYPLFHYNLGVALVEQGDFASAITSYKKAIALEPNYPEAHNNLGNAFRDQGDLITAIACYKKALELKFNYPDAYYNLGNALQDEGDLDNALINYQKAFEIDPESSDALYGIGRIQAMKGDLKNSKHSFKKAIDLNPSHTSVLFELSRNLHSSLDSENLLKSLDKVNKAGLSKRDESLLSFALANCHHKLKDYARATQNLVIANKLKLLYLPSDLSAHLELSETIRVMGAQIPECSATDGAGRIFIVGAPRCGSTLLESVLTTNPNIRDLGESKALYQAFSEITGQTNLNCSKLSLSDAYTEKIQEYLEVYTHSVDKNLYNLKFIEIIARAMPAAKVIHCCRHPLDNILSMLRSNLKNGNNYTADPLDAAKFLVHQKEIMNTFRSKNENYVFTFDYDKFTNEPEKELRLLIDWLELEWNTTYLHPETSQRQIKTASAIQARQPINKKSLGGWKNYKNLLKTAEQFLCDSGVFDLG